MKSFQIFGEIAATAARIQTTVDFGDVLFSTPVKIYGFRSSGRIRNAADTASTQLTGTDWRFSINNMNINVPPPLVDSILPPSDIFPTNYRYYIPIASPLLDLEIDLTSASNNQFAMFGIALHTAAVAGDVVSQELTIYYDYSQPNGNRPLPLRVNQPKGLKSLFPNPKFNP